MSFKKRQKVLLNIIAIVLIRHYARGAHFLNQDEFGPVGCDPAHLLCKIKESSKMLGEEGGFDREKEGSSRVRHCVEENL